MTYHDLLRKLHDQPFKPFRVRLTNSSAIDVLDPGSVIVGESSAILPTDVIADDRGYRLVRDWKTVAIAHMVEFIDLNVKSNGKRKRAS